MAFYLLPPSSNITNCEHTSQFELLKDPQTNRVNDLSLDKTKPVNFDDNLLTFFDTDKEFEMGGDRLKMITNKYYNVDLAKILDKKLLFEFAKKMNCD